jgi:GAF domain-containing protein
MGSQAQLAALLEPILDAAIDATDASRGNIQILDGDGTSLHIIVQRGFQKRFLKFFDTVHANSFACGIALKRRARTVVPDVRQSRLFTEEARAVMLDARACACQSTPIVTAQGTIVGILSTHFSAPHVPTSSALTRVDTLADRAAELISSVRAGR